MMVTKTLKLVLIIIISLVLIQKRPTFVNAQDTGWSIQTFESSIRIKDDTTLQITETIVVDFNSLLKHGIYRSIPINYVTEYGNVLSTRFQLRSITDQYGNDIEWTMSKNNGFVELKIGDPEVTIKGINTYIISYNVQRVLTKQSENVEFYWNVTGNNWPVEINDVIVHVHAPTESLRTKCFTGIVGSTEENCRIEKENLSTNFTTQNLKPGEGLTIVSQFDSKEFTFPSTIQEILWFIMDNWPYVIPLSIILILLRLYWLNGRDRQYINVFHEGEKIKPVPFFSRINPIMTFHPPTNVSAGEVGVLVDEFVNTQDITATIIDLATRGYFTVEEFKKGKIIKKSDYKFVLTGKDEKELKPYEKLVLDMLFSVSRTSEITLSKLHKNAYKYLDQAKKELYSQVVSDGYFSKSPQDVRTQYVIAGIIVIALSFFVGPFYIEKTGSVSMLLSLIISGIFVLLFARFMPARTAKGRKVLADIVGLKEFIRVGSWRQKEYEKRNFFEEILPYTIVFGMTEKFINAFKGSNIPRPNWYKGTGSFNVVAFNNSLSTIGNNVSSAVSSTRPKSSGSSGFSGGSSGGGFGGGGGGSW